MVQTREQEWKREWEKMGKNICLYYLPGQPLLDGAREALQSLLAEAHAFAFNTVLAPIDSKVQDVPRMTVGCGGHGM